MHWGLSTIVLTPRGRYGKPPNREERRKLFGWAQKSGFEGIEMSPRWLNLLDSTLTELTEIRTEIHDAGMDIAGINVDRCILTRSDNAIWHRQKLKRSIEIASELRAGIISFALSLEFGDIARPVLYGSDVPESEFLQSAELVRELNQYARSLGVQLCVELHDDGLLDSPELCIRFLREVGSPSIRVNPDLGNLCRNPCRPGDWARALDLLAPETGFWHVKNYRNCVQTVLPDGEIDYQIAAQKMKNAGYDGWVSIESRTGDFYENQIQSLKYLQGLFCD